MEGTGTVGLVVVGLGGVGSSLLTGVLAARAHLVHPFGSLAEGGGSGRAPGFGLAAPRGGAAGRAGRSRARRIRGARGRSLSRRAAGASHQPFAGGRAAARAAEDPCHDRRATSADTAPSGGRAGGGSAGLSRASPLRPRRRGLHDPWRPRRTGEAGVQRERSAGGAGTERRLDHAWRRLCRRRGRGRVRLRSRGAGSGALRSRHLRAVRGEVAASRGRWPAGARRAAARDPGADPGDGGDAARRRRLAVDRAEERGTSLWGGPDRTSEMGLGTAWAGGAFRAIARAARSRRALSRCAGPRRGIAGRAGRARAEERGAGVDALFLSPLGSASPHEARTVSLAGRRGRLLAELPTLARSAGREAA